MLTLVSFVLRRYPAVGALPHLHNLISSFLGPPSDLSLSEACSFGSTRLLDWIWVSSCTSGSARSAGFSVMNYLRSDPHYYRWQFTRALKVALKNGRLTLIKWLLEHFSDCDVPVKAVKAAVKKGHVQTLELLMTFGRPDSRQVVPVETMDALGFQFLLRAIRQGHTEVIRWLYQHSTYEPSDLERKAFIRIAMHFKNCTLAELLVPKDRQMAEFYSPVASADETKRMLDNGELQRDQNKAAHAIAQVAKSGNLTLMQQITQLHSPPPTDNRQWSTYWYSAICSACQSGDLFMLKWLVEHPTGRERCEQLKRGDFGDDVSELLEIGLEQSHIDVLHFLYEQGLAERS